MYYARFGLIFTICLSIVGCSFFYGYVPRQDQGNSINKTDISKLSKGLNTNQVKEIFGPPLAQSNSIANSWVFIFYSNEQKIYENKINYLRVYFNDAGYVEKWEQSKLPHRNFVR